MIKIKRSVNVIILIFSCVFMLSGTVLHAAWKRIPERVPQSSKYNIEVATKDSLLVTDIFTKYKYTTIYGKVTDKLTGVGIGNALVRVYYKYYYIGPYHSIYPFYYRPRQAYTNRSGNYTIKVPPYPYYYYPYWPTPSSYVCGVSASKSDYTTSSKKVTVHAYQANKVDFELKEVFDAPILQTITDPDNDGHYAASWTETSGGALTLFELVEDDNADFSSPTATYWVSGLTENIIKTQTGLYYYRVRGWTAPQASGGWATSWSTSESIQLDAVPPQSPTLSIDEPAKVNFTTITLLLSAIDASEMIISEDSGFSGASWEPYSTTKEFVVSSGDATKTLYVKYRDLLHNESVSVSASVGLDQTSPTVTTAIHDDYYTHDEVITVQGEVDEVCSGVLVNGLPAILSGNSFSVTLTLVPGDNVIVASATDEAGNTGSSTAETISYEESFRKNSQSNEEVWRINCGAEFDATDSVSNSWLKDEDYYVIWRWGYVGGTNSISSTPVIGTDLQSVYKTSRWGMSSYKIDVPNGDFTVRLLLAETHFDNPGDRVFSIDLEGSTVWSAVDIYDLAGGKNIACELSSPITVTDGCLDIDFTAITDQPVISGIEISVVSVDDEDFLEFIQKKMFWFFWNEYNSTTGLVAWGANNFQAGGIGPSGHLASNGFALSCYTIAAERGWVDPAVAESRALAILNSFQSTVAGTHGFWYHIFDISTGARAESSEVSTVDSALFIMGALQAGEYFGGPVKTAADTLYEDMQWSWFTGTGGNPDFVNMGWKPDAGDPDYTTAAPGGGYYCNYHWTDFSESVFVNLLAIASPAYAAGIQCWDNMGGMTPAYAYSLEYVQQPPLFIHQFHHLYYDMTDIQNNGLDYFKNSQQATLANRQECLEDPTQRYEPKRWGLSACGGPGGYVAYGGPYGYHDGTVAPTAALTSIMFTQEESIETARYMFFQYKQYVWGRYGFSSGLNVEQGYVDPYMNGLDNGPMIIAIENWRTGLIQDMFMASSYAQDGLSTAGFSSTPTISASSEESVYLAASNAVDGDMGSRWSSRFYTPAIPGVEIPPQWIEVDLQTSTSISQVTLYWETAYASSYKIQVSQDRLKWTDVYETTSSSGGTEIIPFSTVSTRYVRVYMTGRATPWGYSLYEMEIS